MANEWTTLKRHLRRSKHFFLNHKKLVIRNKELMMKMENHGGISKNYRFILLRIKLNLLE